MGDAQLSLTNLSPSFPSPQVNATELHESLRVWSFCGATARTVVMLALNFHPRNTLLLTPSLGGGAGNQSRWAWHVRAAGGAPITSRHVEVQTDAKSWKMLTIAADGVVPDIMPMMEDARLPTVLPPHSYVIAVMNGTQVDARACDDAT